MSFSTFADSLKSSMLSMFCTAATFTPDGGESVSCSVKIGFDVMLQPNSYDAQVVETGTTVDAFYSEVGEPEKGDIFLVDSVSYSVVRITDNDKTFVTMVVK